MKEKIASLLLICLVALSIVYVCSRTALSRHTTRYKDAVPSRPASVTKEPPQNVKPSYPEPIPLGDPIDDPKPNK